MILQLKHLLTMLLFLTIMAGCGKRPDVADPQGNGDVSETVAKIQGNIVDTLGRPAPKTHVQLLPADYDPVAGLSSGDTLPTPDTTDASGEYIITVSDTGTYNVEAVHLAERTMLLIRGVEYDKDDEDDTITVPTDTLKQPGAIVLSIPDTVDTTGAYVYIPGTSQKSEIRGQRSVVLDSVPAGIIPEIRYASLFSSFVLDDSITVAPNDTTYAAALAGWKYTKWIILNTSSTGANITEDVYNFPILIRLRDSTFNFAQCRSDGADLRFTDSQGHRVISYETERYDSINGLAEIWVLVDTVFGNNAAQHILMHWGNDTASNTSNPGAVFDTANGYAGVWHLNEDFGDATVNANHGTNSGSLSTNGAVGQAQLFDGVDDYIGVANATSLQLGVRVWTVSAWVFADDTTGHRPILTKTPSSMEKEYELSMNGGKVLVEIETGGNNAWVETDRVRLPEGAWYLLSATFNGSTLETEIYVNGEKKTIINTIPELPTDFSADVEIGRRGYGNEYFDGIIDEVRISETVRSAAWMKLCHENQKENQTLVEIP